MDNAQPDEATQTGDSGRTVEGVGRAARENRGAGKTSGDEHVLELAQAMKIVGEGERETWSELSRHLEQG